LVAKKRGVWMSAVHKMIGLVGLKVPKKIFAWHDLNMT